MKPRIFELAKDSYGKKVIFGPEYKVTEVIPVIEYEWTPPNEVIDKEKLTHRLYEVSLKSSQTTNLWWLIKYKIKNWRTK